MAGIPGRRRSILKSRTSLGAEDMSECTSILDENQGPSGEVPLIGGTEGTSPTSRRRRVSFAHDTHVRQIRDDSVEGVTVYMDLTQVNNPEEHSPIDHFNTTTFYNDQESMRPLNDSGDGTAMSMFMDLTQVNTATVYETMSMSISQMMNGSPEDRRSVSMDLTQVSQGDDLSPHFVNYNATRLGGQSMEITFDDEEEENCPPPPLLPEPIPVSKKVQQKQQLRKDSFPQFVNLNLAHYGAAPSTYLLQKPRGFGPTTSRFGQFASVKTPHRQRTFIPRPRMTSASSQTSTPPSTLNGGARDQVKPKPLGQMENLPPKGNITMTLYGGMSEEPALENLLSTSKVDGRTPTRTLLLGASEPTGELPLPPKGQCEDGGISMTVLDETPEAGFLQSHHTLSQVEDKTETEGLSMTMTEVTTEPQFSETPQAHLSFENENGNGTVSMTMTPLDKTELTEFDCPLNGSHTAPPNEDEEEIGPVTVTLPEPTPEPLPFVESNKHVPSNVSQSLTMTLDESWTGTEEPSGHTILGTTEMEMDNGTSSLPATPSELQISPVAPHAPSTMDKSVSMISVNGISRSDESSEQELLTTMLERTSLTFPVTTEPELPLPPLEPNHGNFPSKVDKSLSIALDGMSGSEELSGRNSVATTTMDEDGSTSLAFPEMSSGPELPFAEPLHPPPQANKSLSKTVIGGRSEVKRPGRDRFGGLSGLDKVRALEKLDLDLEPLSPDELEKFLMDHGSEFVEKWVGVTMENIKTSRLMTLDEEDMKKLILN